MQKFKRRLKKNLFPIIITIQGISKGRVVENLLSTMVATNKAPDFILCIGDDRSDEDMFEAISSLKNKNDCPSASNAEVFACTVGKKPSMARYYLDDTVDVMKMLQGLADVSVSHRPKMEIRLPVSFEGPL
jgi:trehalose 6-phosphate synthase/phosphatase